MGGRAGEVAAYCQLSGEAIPGKTSLPDLPDKVVKDLSSDQHYGYRITKAIRSGKMDTVSLLVAALFSLIIQYHTLPIYLYSIPMVLYGIAL